MLSLNCHPYPDGLLHELPLQGVISHMQRHKEQFSPILGPLLALLSVRRHVAMSGTDLLACVAGATSRNPVAGCHPLPS